MLLSAERVVGDLRRYFGIGMPPGGVPFTGSRFEHLVGGGDRPEVADRIMAEDLVAEQHRFLERGHQVEDPAWLLRLGHPGERLLLPPGFDDLFHGLGVGVLEVAAFEVVAGHRLHRASAPSISFSNTSTGSGRSSVGSRRPARRDRRAADRGDGGRTHCRVPAVRDAVAGRSRSAFTGR
ncbi:DUF6308 family protein [Streptomyces coriariae]|uniref:DUF6308 family protein n=1 Tax=Streptomyces coriariae TaxID=2864460 RepID=UPI0022811F5E|nr:DUF6308 family protein [Streptomyces coriariae]